MNHEELPIIVKYEMDKAINILINYIKKYDCTDHQESCRENGKSADECKGASATAKIVLDVLDNWTDFYDPRY